MNQDVLEGKWKELRGTLREKWGQLTDDDLEQIAGHRDKLQGMLQQRYGWTREEAERQITDFTREAERRYGWGNTPGDMPRE